MNWYEKNPRRLKTEISEMEKIFPSFVLFQDDNNNFYWKGSIVHDNDTYQIKISYPPAFPSIRPKVFILTEDGILLENFQSTHQNKDGSICLYTNDRGPEGWKIRYTAKDVLDKLILLFKLRGNKEIEDLHTSYFKRFYGHKINKFIFVVPKEFQDFIYKYKSGSFVSLTNNSDSQLRLVGLLAKEGENITLNVEDSSWSPIQLIRDSVVRGSWFFLRRKPPSWYSLRSNRSILYLIRQNKYQLPKIREMFPIILFYKDRRNLYATAFIMKQGDEEFLREKPGYLDVDVIDLGDELFKRNKEKIGGGLDILKNKKVVIIGLGSIGSSVVIELAKSGVGNFVLYDPDVLEFSNISKHAGDLQDVFRPKVNILEDRIKKINPTAIVDKRRASPLDENHASEFLEILESDIENTLLIVTPAEHETEAIINEYSINLGISAIYGTALDGADFGRIFRVDPGNTACYECISILNETQPERFPSITSDETAANLGEFEAYRHPGFPGMSIDVGFINLIISRLALQTLLRDTDSEKLFPDSDTNHILWSNRKGWNFDAPLQTRYIDYPKVIDCPICGEKSDIIPLTSEETKEYEDLMRSIKKEELSDNEQ